MPAAKNVTIYLRTRRWVDHDLATQRRPLSIFGPLFFIILVMTGAHFIGPVAEGSARVVIIPLGAGWAAFVAWRITRLLRAVSIIGDREFDQRGKFLLSPEYHRSESVTATSQRKRLRRRGRGR